MDELKKAQPTIINELKKIANEKIDIHQLVRERLESFDLMQMERMVHQVARKEFRAIEIWGAVLGIIIGLVQATIFLFVG